MTPSQARNAIKKSLKAIIDPKPSKADKEKIWRYFENQCAYCGCELNPNDRKAHLDHVVAEAEGGSNQLCNLILTCAECNGDEKREKDWQIFLLKKCHEDNPNDNLSETPKYQKRYNKITRWITEQGGSAMLMSEQQAQLESAFNTVDALYSNVVEQLRNQHKTN